MVFDGFIELPNEGFINVLDYLTLNDHTLFATSASTGSVFKIDLIPVNPTASAVSLLHGSGSAHGVALVPDLKLAFVTRSEANKVDVFDPISLKPLASISVADDADAIHYLPSSRLLYVASGEPKLATLIDPAQRATVGTIALPGKPEFAAFDPQTGWLYQNIEDTSTVVAIDVNKRTIMGEWSLAPCEGPSGMAIDSERRRLFSVCAKNATLVVFDLDRHRIVTSLKIGFKPDSVALDPSLHRIYSTGEAGELTVIQQDGPDAYRVLDQIYTHFGAHTLAVDPVSHEVFVAYASLLVSPRIAVFTPVM
jgi:DNA-binding beta-propeller fold protein YncE